MEVRGVIMFSQSASTRQLLVKRDQWQIQWALKITIPVRVNYFSFLLTICLRVVITGKGEGPLNCLIMPING